MIVFYYRRRPVRKIVKKKSRFFWKISRVQNCRVDHKYRSSLLRRQSYTQVYDINTDILSLVYLHRLKHTHEIQIIHTSHSIIYIYSNTIKKYTFESFESFEAFVKKTIKKAKTNIQKKHHH